MSTLKRIALLCSGAALILAGMWGAFYVAGHVLDSLEHWAAFPSIMTGALVCVAGIMVITWGAAE